jgi:hypothetical protein
MQLFISTADQLFGLSRFKSALALYENGGLDCPPPPETLTGVDENGSGVSAVFVAPGTTYAGAAHVVHVVTSRDLDQVDPLIQEMGLGNNADGANIADVSILVLAQ